MSDKIQVEPSELKELFLFLEDLNHFFHQPMHYEDQEQVKSYVEGMYPKLHSMFYDVVWNWLPPKMQKEIIDRPSPLAK